MKKIKNISQLLEKYNSYKITKEELRHLLKSEPIGRVTGIIGPFVLRYHKNRLIISNRAVFYNTSQSAESVQNRNKFGAGIKFAKALNKIDIIKKLWKQSNAEGISAYHKLIKHNRILNGHPTAQNSITPSNNKIYIEKICSLSEDFSLKINNNLNLERNASLVVVLVPYDPINHSDQSFEVIHLSECKLSQEQIQVCRNYKKYLLYSAVLKEDGNGIEWSNTVAEEGSLINSEEIAQSMYIFLIWILAQRISEKYSYQLKYKKNHARDG